MTKFAQFALVLEGLAAFAAGLYFLNEGRAGVGVVLLILGLFSTVAVLATSAPELTLPRNAMDCDTCRHGSDPNGFCSCPVEKPPVRR